MELLRSSAPCFMLYPTMRPSWELFLQPQDFQFQPHNTREPPQHFFCCAYSFRVIDACKLPIMTA